VTFWSAWATLKVPSISAEVGELAREALRPGCRGGRPEDGTDEEGQPKMPKEEEDRPELEGARSHAAATTHRNLERLGFVPRQQFVVSTPLIQKRRRRWCWGGGLRREESPELAGIDRQPKRRQRGSEVW
jgi:hypothetical protein